MTDVIDEYEDLTEEFKNINHDVKPIERRLCYAIDKYKNKYFDMYYDPRKTMKEELKYQKILERKIGYKIFLNPKTRVQNVKTPDYWIMDKDELWDYKGIDGNGKNIIDNIFHKAECQTYNLILRQRKTKLNIRQIKCEITKIFKSGRRLGIKQVILLDRRNNIILYYKRK